MINIPNAVKNFEKVLGGKVNLMGFNPENSMFTFELVDNGITTIFTASMDETIKICITKVGPVFPLSSINLFGDGYVSTSKTDEGTQEDYKKQGNTFYTTEEAQAEAERRAAEVQVRERINQENKGDNGFKHSDHNFLLSWGFQSRKIRYSHYVDIQYANDWEYLRTVDSAKKLQTDEEFVKLWKIAKGIE